VDTTATNKRIREIISDLADKRLIPNPSFQRRLVWSQKHKSDFIKTILDGLPFPEIYIAAGSVDPETARGHSMLVDGQQRVSTIYEYFQGSPNLKLAPSVLTYQNLSDQEKKDFLEYKVVVRDLGTLDLPSIKNIFQRINSTAYSLNAIEIANARYDNDLKALADEISQMPFWESNRVFKSNEIKRMGDLNFILVLIITFMSGYFNRDDRIEEFLKRYNDGFEDKNAVRDQALQTLGFLEDLSLPKGGRSWQRADLFSLIVEIHRAFFKENIRPDQNKLKKSLEAFFSSIEERRPSVIGQRKLNLEVDNFPKDLTQLDLDVYYNATTDATNDRVSRIRRGGVLQKIISNSV
jgi:hypothetical protein